MGIKTASPLVKLAEQANALDEVEFAKTFGDSFLLFSPVDDRAYDTWGISETRPATGPTSFRPTDPGSFFAAGFDKSRTAPIMIGRSSTCDVVIPDDSVSGMHCCLRLEDGQWRAYDANSTNGTRVNEAAAPTLDSDAAGVPIAPMSRIRLGDFEATWLEAPQLQRMARAARPKS